MPVQSTSSQRLVLPRNYSGARKPCSKHGDPFKADGSWQIVDFIIWLLFSRGKASSNKPQHLLCDGFRRGTGQQAAPRSIQGLYSLYFNERVANIKQAPWPQLLHILGKSGESMMINLLLDCSIFLPVEAGQGNYYQLSGKKLDFHRYFESIAKG